MLLIQPLKHLLELELTKRNVHFLAVHRVHIVDQLPQVCCLDADNLWIALLVVSEYVSIQWIKHLHFLDEVIEEFFDSVPVNVVQLTVFIQVVAFLSLHVRKLVIKLI